MLRFIYSLSIILIMSHSAADAQFTENFNDGDFTMNPTWTGSSSEWIVNASGQLQSNSSVPNSIFYLSTPSTLANIAQWELFVQLSFNPSSANYTDVYLISSASDLTLANNTGYFVRLGNTNDEVCLYRKDGNGTSTMIINGTDGILNSSNNILKIKITRDAANKWTLYRDLGATGNNYFSEGTVTDASYNSSSWFGILVKQSTASFFQHHFFDDIEVKTYVPDLTPPVIISANTVSTLALDVLFNEPLDPASCQLVGNYIANNNLGTPQTAVRDAQNTSLVHLTFTLSFPNAINCQLTVNGVKDLAGNAIINGIVYFSYFLPDRYDIVIDEIMADPSPPVGLPNLEWIELRNRSSFPVNLQGWKINDPNTQSGPLPAIILKPDSMLILCSTSAASAMTTFGNTLPVISFPSLNNDGDLLVLQNASGKIIHAVNYSSSWYGNVLKKQGGWSLEMIDINNPCSGAGNWSASIDGRGGTPGSRNSINGNNRDSSAPRLYRAWTKDSISIHLVFDEPLDSLSASNTSQYTISDGIGNPLKVICMSPVFDQVELTLATPIIRGKIYTVSSGNQVKDCTGNPLGARNFARFGLPEPAAKMDIVINEVLFNPLPDGVDYVEMVNRSNKILDLQKVYLANRDASGTISSTQQLYNNHFLFFPQDYMVITEDPTIVKRQYNVMNPDNFITLSSLPSYPDDKGDVVLLNDQGNIIDELVYTDKWHFPLISNPEGVSLERLDLEGPTQNADNWHSAATSSGYGTPTYKNSQYRPEENKTGTINVFPEVFSPDNDGLDDFVTIAYDLSEPGYVTNISIFDAAGRMVRSLQRNALCGNKGYFRWDGLGEKNHLLSAGIYIVFTEIFNLAGKRKQFKNAVVLAKRKN